MNSLIHFFNCGKLTLSSEKRAVNFVVWKIEDIINKIIPVFNNYPLLGEKYKDFRAPLRFHFIWKLDFKESAAGLIQNKFHLTSEGIEKIQQIKSGMNRGRVNNFSGKRSMSSSARSGPVNDNLPRSKRSNKRSEYNMLTPVALAHIIMGDGTAREYGLEICTNSYSLEDVVRLMNVLIIRYRLKCNIRIKFRDNKKIQNEYTIYIRQSSVSLLRTVVTPYFHPSMLYKLGL